jgi:hypothetical protein
MIEKMEELQVEDNHTTLPMIYKSGTNTTFVVSFDDVEECLR